MENFDDGDAYATYSHDANKGRSDCQGPVFRCIKK